MRKTARPDAACAAGTHPSSLPGGWKKEASGTEPSYGKPVLFFRDVCFAYEKGEPVLQNLRMELREWELLCLLGGNGSGKSTL